jgi:RNA polymerase sigma-70 factor (ECF subfamily)
VAANQHRAGQLREPGDARLTAALARARQGDERAFQALYRQLHPALARYLTTRLGDETAAAAAASAVWRDIANGVFGFRGDGTDLRVWAVSLARRRIPDRPRPAPAPDRAGLADDVQHVLSALPPDLADALLLRVAVGLDDASAARVLDTTAPSVPSTAHHALRLVDSCLASRPFPDAPREQWACSWC